MSLLTTQPAAISSCTTCQRTRPVGELAVYRERVSSTVTFYATYCADNPECEARLPDAAQAFARRVAGERS